jgi:hypothetical protein
MGLQLAEKDQGDTLAKANNPTAGNDAGHAQDSAGQCDQPTSLFWRDAVVYVAPGRVHKSVTA